MASAAGFIQHLARISYREGSRLAGRIIRTRTSHRTKIKSEDAVSLKQAPVMVLMTAVAMTRGFSLFSSKEEFPKKDGKAITLSKGRVTDIIKKADEYYDQSQPEATYDLLKPLAETGLDEVLWRLARTTYELSKQPQHSAEETKALVFEAFEYVQKALASNPSSSPAHKWMSILLDKSSAYHGMKERITQSPNVKEHMIKAMTLNPHDATTVYLLGYWCYSVADLPWYQRKIASAVFATPPESSYSEALNYFLKAENMDPYFYSMNLLMIGKSYLKLGTKDKARMYLTVAASYIPKTDEDRDATKEAANLLRTL